MRLASDSADVEFMVRVIAQPAADNENCLSDLEFVGPPNRLWRTSLSG